MWLMLIGLSHRGRRFSLPIPIFPVWILMAPLILVGLLLTLARHPSYWRVLPCVVPLLFQLGGLQIDVNRKAETSVRIRFV
jgi:hypothetical protein